MRIHTPSTQSTQNLKRKRTSSATSGSEFSSFLDEAEEASAQGSSAPTQSIGTLSGIDTMLSLQEVSDEDVARQKAYKQGALTLEKLEQLRHALLMGSVPEHLLRDMERMVAQQRQNNLPSELNAVLDDIELRAAVELAKLEQAQGK